MCAVQRTVVNTYEHIVRYCADVRNNDKDCKKTENLPAKYYNQQGAAITEHETCYCAGDECNSAPLATGTILFITVAAICTLIFK